MVCFLVFRMEAIGDVASSLFEGGSELYGYNRAGFIFDESMRQEREYQEQNMRVKQFLLYREDVRDLVELTTGKMDSYILPVSFMLGACILILVEGQVEDEPPWLLWLQVISLAEAVLYFFMSIWLAMHASVSAHSFGVRLLTQLVRLPVPRKQQINAARAMAEEFEGGGVKGMFKMPMVQNTPTTQIQEDGTYHAPSASSRSRVTLVPPDPQPSPGGSLQSVDSPQELVSGLRHIRLFRDLQSNWQAHDAYARVCMSLGTYALVHNIAYYLIGKCTFNLHCFAGAVGAAIICSTLGWLLLSIDIYFGTVWSALCGLFIVSGPLLAAIAAGLSNSTDPQLKCVWGIIVPIVFILNVIHICLCVYISRAEQLDETKVALPTRFRNVLYLDVFGWLDEHRIRQAMTSSNSETNELTVNDQTTSVLPGACLQSLREECAKLAEGIRTEIEMWDCDQNRPNIRSIPKIRHQLKHLRQQFNAEANQLGVEKAIQRVDVPEAAVGVWMRVMWTAGATHAEYFVDADTGEAKMQAPPGVLVSCLDNIQEQITELHHRIEALRKSGVQTKAGSGNIETRSSDAFDNSNIVGKKHGVEHEFSAQSRRSAQEVRFGGWQAAGGGFEHAFDETVVSAATFHPRRASRRESSRAPGQVPWYTFIFLSVMLMLTWISGTVFFAVRISVGIVTGESGTEPRDLDAIHGMRLAFGYDDWPTTVVGAQFQNLACHANVGSTGFVVEKYGVYTIPLKMDEEAINQSRELADQKLAVDRCLAQEPAFQSGGIGGLHLECEDQCVAVLISLQGDRALRCPLPRREHGVATRTLDSPVFEVRRDGGLLLRAPLSESTLGAWALPHGSWRGACVTDQDLFLLAAHTSSAEVWRFDLTDVFSFHRDALVPAQVVHKSLGANVAAGPRHG